MSVDPAPAVSAAPILQPDASTGMHLAYLHAWPLIGRLGTSPPFTIKKLDFDSERALLFKTLDQANKAIRLQMEVATSDNLLRLITMGCRAIHYTGHGLPTCFPSVDTRVLTNAGFLFLDEIQSRLCDPAAAEPLLFACYDVASKSYVYRPHIGDLIVKDHSGDLIDFTPLDQRSSWDHASSDYARDHSRGVTNNFSLRVTPDHHMFAQTACSTNGADLSPPTKYLASDLHANPAYELIRMVTCAEAGNDICQIHTPEKEITMALGIDTEHQLNAFMEIYGFWLAAGSLSHTCLRFGPSTVTSHGATIWLRDTCLRARIEPTEFREEMTPDGNEFTITADRWVKYFNSQVSASSAADPVDRIFAWCRHASRAHLRLLIAGMQRAERDFSPASNVIHTYSIACRDALMVLMLHAGYAAHFECEHSTPATSDNGSVCWRLTFADPATIDGSSVCQPTLDRRTDVARVPFDGQVWCLTVDHPDHLIVAQRAHRNKHGVVTKAAQPTIVGQCLAFEDDEGKMHPMDPTQLKELVEAGRSSSSSDSRGSGIEFAFVSACHSESAGMAFVAAGVPHVIAVKTEAAVCDRASQVFMNHFYLALLVGKTVRQSFDIGQKAVRHNPRLAGGDEPRKFLLLPEHADHERTLFTDIPSGRWTDASVPPAPHMIPAIPENFLGRNFLIQQVIACLAKKRLVTLTGARGIGKTSVAVATARYIWKRNHFDGVFMVDLTKLAPGATHEEHRHHTDTNTNTGAHRESKEQAHTLSTLVSQSCQLDELHRNPARLFRALQSIPRLLLILDGADAILRQDESGGAEGEGEGRAPSASSSSLVTSHPHHDLRSFISDLLRAVPGSKVLVTSRFALAGIQEVVEAQFEVHPLAPIDAAQLFYDLRPREIELAEFGCEDPKRAASKLSEHPALKLLAGHPRRIFNAVPNLREVKMGDLTAIIEQQIKKEKRIEQQQSEAWSQLQIPTHAQAKAVSRSHTPEPSPVHHVRPHQTGASELFDHNLFLWFGGSTPRSGCSFEDASVWGEISERGANWWRTTFGRVEIVAWNDTLDRIINHQFMTAIGSNERPLESLDLRTLQAKLESLGSPVGYMHVQVFGSFWRDWLAFTDTIRKVLPYWIYATPTRIIHGWCNRTTCTNLLIESIEPQSGQVTTKPVGTFALRMSESQVGSIAVGYVDETHQIRHTLITMRGYTSLSDLLLQCRPFISLYPGVDKLAVLAPTISTTIGEGASGVGVALPGEGTPAAQAATGQFQSFPNNATGGGVGLLSPPPPGTHGGPIQGSHAFAFGVPNPLERVPLVHAQSAFTAAHAAAAAAAGVGAASSHTHSLAHHPHSFPSMSGLSAALPSSNLADGLVCASAAPGEPQHQPHQHGEGAPHTAEGAPWQSPPGGIK